MNDGREYRYQKDWSIDSQMFHVRCDEWDVFKEAVANMTTILPINGDKAVVSQPIPSQLVQQAVSEKCVKCGAPMAISKAGNKYCSQRCWLK